MAPSKRAAGTQAQSAAKKPKVDAEMKKSCKVIADCIGKSDEIPDNTKSMLVAMIKAAPVANDTFYVEHYAAAVFKKMFDSTLETLEAGITKQIVAAEERLTGADAEYQGLMQLVEMAEKSLTEKKELAAKAKTALAESAAAIIKSKEEMNAAESAQQTLDETHQKQTAEEEALKSALSTIERLKISTDQAEAMKEASATMAILRNLNLDESLLSAVPSALGKASTDRGEFETVVVDQLAAALSSKIADLEQTLSAAEPERQQKTATTTEKKEAHDAAAAKHETVADELSAAQKELADGENRLRVSKLQVKDHLPVTELRKQDLQKLKDNLESFKQGPFAAFKVMCTPPPAEEVPAADAPAKTAEEPEVVSCTFD